MSKSELPLAGKRSHETVISDGKASRETHLRKAPRLRHGDDEAKAAELEQYISEAECGLRAILKAGFFIECIAADLPRGQLGPWVEAHCPNRKWRTVRRWKEVAAGVGDIIGIKYEKRVKLELHKVLSLPMSQLPDKLKPIREKIETEIEGKSYRQLFLELKQCDEDGRPKRGNLSGKGCTREHRANAAAIEEEERIAALNLESEDLAKRLLELSGPKGIGDYDHDHLAAFWPAIQTAYNFTRDLLASRKGAPQA